MNGRKVLAILITALGVVITIANLRDGLELSLALLISPLMLGLLLIVDGALRFFMLRDETESPEPHAD